MASAAWTGVASADFDMSVRAGPERRSRLLLHSHTSPARAGARSWSRVEDRQYLGVQKQVPLTTLPSWTWIAHTIEVDNTFEAGGSGRLGRQSRTSLPIWTNGLRFIDEAGITVDRRLWPQVLSGVEERWRTRFGDDVIDTAKTLAMFRRHPTGPLPASPAATSRSCTRPPTLTPACDPGALWDGPPSSVTWRVTDENK